MNTSNLHLSMIRGLSIVDSSLFTQSYDVILCYHSIEENMSTFNVTPELFSEHMKALNEVCALTDFKELVTTQNDGTSIRVAVSFDDGYKSVYEHAYPVLEKYEIGAGVFILGDPNNAENTIGEKYLSKAQLIKLKRSGWSIGWHTERHFNLIKNNTELVTEDFRQGKDMLRSISNQKINYVAYPYGMYNNEVENCARGAGFTKAFTVDGFIANSNKYSIDRVTITSDMLAKDVVNLIRPLGLLVNKSFTYLWNKKDRN